jgi:hypothetical protein
VTRVAGVECTALRLLSFDAPVLSHATPPNGPISGTSQCYRF